MKALLKKLTQNPLVAFLRKAVLFVVGWVILIVGLILLPTPVPVGAFMVPVGLLILATEFPWARRALAKIRDNATMLSRKLGIPVEKFLPQKSDVNEDQAKEGQLHRSIQEKTAWQRKHLS